MSDAPSAAQLLLLLEYAMEPGQCVIADPIFDMPIVQRHLRGVVSMGLLTLLPAPTPSITPRPLREELAITDKGRAYLAALAAVPLPEEQTRWVTAYPKDEE